MSFLNLPIAPKLLVISYFSLNIVKLSKENFFLSFFWYELSVSVTNVLKLLKFLTILVKDLGLAGLNPEDSTIHI